MEKKRKYFNQIRFTTIPLKALSDKYELDIYIFVYWKLIIFNRGFSTKLSENNGEINRI